MDTTVEKANQKRRCCLVSKAATKNVSAALIISAGMSLFSYM